MSGSQGKNPRVSIGMPAFNREKYVAAAIEAHLEQTYSNFELIITDNASTDRTAEICQGYAVKDQRVKYFRNQTNLGAAGNYRRCFELATGEFFRWAPSDDLVSPNFLERAVQVLDSDPSIFVAYGRTKLIDAEGNITGDFEEALHLMQDRASERWIAVSRNLRLGNLHYGLNRAAWLRETGLLRNYLGGDFPLIAEMSLYGKFHEISEAVFYRRIHAEASSAQRDAKAIMATYDPGKRSQLFLYNWVHLGANLKSIARAPISLSEKISLYVFEGKRVIWNRKVFFNELLTAVKCKGRKLIHS
jgi:glycosyltransferase involved in cell wall biosynthesis